jgi:hypothetical protein
MTSQASTAEAVQDSSNARRLGLCSLVVCAVAFAAPEAGTSPPDSSWRELAPKLYIQDETHADVDYIKSEVTFVSYVRDRTEADVQLTITRQSTGDGGWEYCLTFLGLGDYRDIGSLLKHTTAPDATDDETRQALVEAIRRGLVPYVSRTRLRDYLSVEFEPPTRAVVVADPWRNWVFSFSLYGWADADESYAYAFGNAYPQVNRVTETEKVELGGGASATFRRFVLDTTVVTALTRSYYANLIYSRKLSEHFAAGAKLKYNNSDYNNIRLGLTCGPNLEYDIVPYTEYVRHKVFVQLLPVVRHWRYFDTTLYNLMGETRFQNEVVLGAKLTRPWGTVEASASGSHYLHDFTKNRLSLYGSLSLRVVAGLSVSLSGGYDFIHDQLSLRKAGASEEERLLRLRELATGWSGWAALSLTYTFGSVYSNIVNPIF